MKSIAAVWLVASRELGERFRTRSFLIVTALVMLLSAGSVIAIEVLPRVFEEKPKQIGVLEAAGAGEALDRALKQSADSLGVDIEVRRYTDLPSGETALRDGDIDALVPGPDRLMFESRADEALTAVASNAMYALALPGMLENLGLDFEDVRPIVQPQGPSISLLDPGQVDKKQVAEERTLVAQAATIVMFLALVLYGQAVLTGVVEEKASRVVEVLLGTLRPEHLLAGKVVGILVAAVGQLLAAFAAAGVALVAVGSANIPSVALDVALVSCVFFVLGILSYSLVFATVGATISRPSESESAQLPVSMALLVPYLLSLTVLTDDPDGLLGRILSILPLTSPMAMPARVATGNPHIAEVVVSIVLLFPWLVAVVWLAARAYAGAILHTGPRISLFAAWRGGSETLSR